MTRVVRSRTVFLWTVIGALALYFASAPADLPRTVLSWPVLLAVAAATTGGVIGACATRCFGWRIGAAAALVWVTLPVVWNRVVTGDAGLLALVGAALVPALAYGVSLVLTWRARATRGVTTIADGVIAAHGFATRRDRGGRIVSWSVLALAAAFAVRSLALHDYRLGEAADAYARVMLDEAGDRFVILNGVADAQMIREEARRNRAAGCPQAESRLLQFREDAAYRTQLVARVRREWPGETNLWAAAEIGPAALADAVYVRHPERVFAMTGQSTTPEKWAARWAKMTPFLGSSDRFVPCLRQAFAFEGNVLANRLQAEGRPAAAWALYARICDEVDPDNAFALANLDGMMRRGHAAPPGWRARVTDRLKTLAQERRLPAPPPDVRTLIAWSNEMIRAHGRGDFATAACIARKILSRPEWRAYIPAQAVMGSVLAQAGDYAAAEVFFRAALSGKGSAAPQPAVLNDYADTLCKLGRYDEAERFAEQAVAASGGATELFRRTLAQVRRAAGKAPMVLRLPPANYGIIQP